MMSLLTSLRPKYKVSRWVLKLDNFLGEIMSSN